MRITQYTPEPGHLAHRVCCYLQRWPFMQLTPATIAQSFGAAVWDVRTALAPACDWGLLRRTGQGAEAIYTTGPHLLDTPLEGVPLPCEATPLTSNAQAKPAREITQ